MTLQHHFQSQHFANGYELINGVAMHAENPDNFLIPHPVLKKRVGGKRACPPEDVGGVWGYADYLEALADPKHKQHEEILQWRGSFDPDKFSAEMTNRAMKKGLPDWRNM